MPFLRARIDRRRGFRSERGFYTDISYIAGNTTVNNSGPLSSPFGGTIVQPVVVAWDEL